MYPSIPRKSARMSRMNFSSSTIRTRGRSSGAVETDMSAGDVDTGRTDAANVKSNRSAQLGCHPSRPRARARQRCGARAARSLAQGPAACECSDTPMAATRDAHALGAQAQRLGAEGPGALGQRRPVLVILGAYAAVGAGAAAASLAFGQ